jgi:hypothetical protein
MVKDTCLQIGFVLRYQIVGPRSSRNQHLLLTNNKYGPQNIIRTVHQIVKKHAIKFTNA